MGTFSTVEPTNVAGWSEEVSGEIVSMYNQGKYGYAYYSKCAVTRLSDNSICVRIKMYSNAIMGWGAGNKAAYIPWGSNGTENEFGPSEAYNYGSGYYLAATYYYTLPSTYTGATVTAGMTSGHRPTTANSPVTLAVPEPVGDALYLKLGGVWKPAQIKVKVGGVWRDAVAKIKVGGTWK